MLPLRENLDEFWIAELALKLMYIYYEYLKTPEKC